MSEFKPRIDDVGAHGELKINGWLWLLIALLTRHIWMAFVVTIAARRVKEAAILYAGFSWWPILMQLPALAVAIVGARRTPEDGRLPRAIWRYGRQLLTLAGVGQVGWLAFKWFDGDRFSTLATTIDITLTVAVVLGLYWTWTSAYSRQLFSEYPVPAPAGADDLPDPRDIVRAEARKAAAEASAATIEPAGPAMQSRSELSLVDMERASRYLVAGEYESTETICRNLLVQNPNDPDATHFLGLALHYQGDDEQAIRLLERSVAMVPSFLDYQANLAAVYRAIGRTEDADRLDARLAQMEGRASGAAGQAPPLPAA